jgi:hypothetical protein
VVAVPNSRDLVAAIRATSEARDLCLALKRVRDGARVLARLRAGEHLELTEEELRLAFGLALAAGEREVVRRALTDLPPERLRTDAVLLTFRDALSRR